MRNGISRFEARPAEAASSLRHALLRFTALCLLLWPNLIAAFAVSCSVTPTSPLFAPRGRRSGLKESALSLGRDSASRMATTRIVPRGGMLNPKAKNSEEDSSISPNGKNQKLQKIALSVVSIALVAWKRGLIISSLRAFRNADLKSLLITKLDAISDLGTTGLVIYSVFFALWEILVGITTPVETAAGMAFGVKRGIIASAIGKIGGAIIAYFIGHLLLQDFVKDKLEGNEMMELVQDSIRENPVGVALIWRFSFLPEFVKNFGLSVLPIKPIHFMTAVFLHGFPFTCLWTFLGAETGALARGVVAEPSRALKILVSGVYVFGFFISPTLVGEFS
mmetsp:Transcript_42238/g.128136  ORF Transcript_42238/g.128136 Transcript_42238/m.128136 type:complete len:336 (-) Transcript_42238:506-1513(-)